MAGTPPPVRVEGIRELVQAFGRIDRGLRGELQSELRELADSVARRAQAIAEQKGLRKSGDLIRTIRPAVRGTVALVRAGATHRGFNYPRRLEYEGGRRASSDPTWFRAPGSRSFLAPALDDKTEDVVAGVEDLLDRLAGEAGFGRGGRI